jgi:TonB-dependent starch-binding outer membrane protein SusC
MFRVATIALGVLLLPAVALAQDPPPPPPPPSDPPPPSERTISGVVKEANGDAVQGAVILVRGRDVSAVTEADGRFRIPGVPGGPVTLEVLGPAHAPREVELPPDQDSVTVTITAVVTEVVLTERAPVIAKQNLANGASVVRAEDLNRVSAQTIEGAMQSKLAGAQIQSNSGAPGGGLQVRLRGVSTIIGQTEPLFVVDGVIVSNVAIPNGIQAVTQSSAGSSSASTQDDQVNRIADLNTNDIESIEVLKGASASALYGSKAANGVVIITTKRGTGTGLRANITQRFGTYQLSNKLGFRQFNSVEEAVGAFKEPAREHYVQGRSFDHEEELAGRNPFANETAINLTGGNRDVTYYLSLNQRNDPGIVIGTGYEKQGGRLAVDANLGSRLRVGFTANLIRSLAQRGVNNNDNSTVSNYMTFPFTPSFLDLQRRPDGTFPTNPFVGSLNNPLQTATLSTNDETVWRAIGSVNAGLVLYSQAQHLLMLQGNLGVDQFEQQNRLFFPPEVHFEPTDGFAGTAIDTNGDNRNLNFSTGLLHKYTGAGFSSATSLGLQLEQRELDVLYVISKGARRPNVDSGTQVTLNQNRQLVRDRGIYLQEEGLFFDQRLSLLAALRGEQSSTAGDPSDLLFFPKAQAAFSLPGMPPQVELLRLRVAYGESGNQPRYGQRFTPLTVVGNLEGNPGQRVREVLGDADIRPERQREIDTGVDAIAFDGRAVLELSVYQKTISDLLLQRTAGSSTGFQTEFLNGGELRNRGVEAMLQVSPVRSGSIEWLTRTIFSLNRSKIIDLPVPKFETGGFGTGLGLYQIEKGKSATQIVGSQGLRPEDNMCCAVKQLGDGEPDFRMTFFQALSWGPFGLSVLADWQKGSNIINLTKYLFDLGQNTPDWGNPGTRVTMEGRMTTVGEDRLENQKTNAGVYIEDASFLKIREIELHLDLPARWVTELGPMKSARVSLAGRNLFTFTGYTGLDPEVSNFGNQPIARNIDVAPYPPSRSFWFSLTAGF